MVVGEVSWTLTTLLDCYNSDIIVSRQPGKLCVTPPACCGTNAGVLGRHDILYVVMSQHKVVLG